MAVADNSALPSEDYRVGCVADELRPLRIVVSGCSGGGKSTLLAALRVRGWRTVDEPGRQIVREQLQLGGTAVPWTNGAAFGELCISRCMHSYNSLRDLAAPVLFDRSLLDNICGMVSIAGSLSPFHARAVETYRFADTVLMAPPWRALFASDAERQHSFEDACAEYDSLLRFYADNGYAIRELERVALYARVEAVEHWLRDLHALAARAND